MAVASAHLNFLDSVVRFRVETDGVTVCCRATPDNPSSDACPVCQAKGRVVAMLTVKALLTETALAQLAGTDYRFCAEPRCAVVYFSTSGQAFTTSDVRVAVSQKQPFGNRVVCYCFGEHEENIRRELETHGSSLAVQRVRDHIRAGRCACEVRNPKGTCCLGDVAAAVERLMAALQAVR